MHKVVSLQVRKQIVKVHFSGTLSLVVGKYEGVLCKLNVTISIVYKDHSSHVLSCCNIEHTLFILFNYIAEASRVSRISLSLIRRALMLLLDYINPSLFFFEYSYFFEYLYIYFLSDYRFHFYNIKYI